MNVLGDLIGHVVSSSVAVAASSAIDSAALYAGIRWQSCEVDSSLSAYARDKDLADQSPRDWSCRNTTKSMPLPWDASVRRLALGAAILGSVAGISLKDLDEHGCLEFRVSMHSSASYWRFQGTVCRSEGHLSLHCSALHRHASIDAYGETVGQLTFYKAISRQSAARGQGLPAQTCTSAAHSRAALSD